MQSKKIYRTRLEIVSMIVMLSQKIRNIPMRLYRERCNKNSRMPGEIFETVPKNCSQCFPLTVLTWNSELEP